MSESNKGKENILKYLKKNGGAFTTNITTDLKIHHYITRQLLTELEKDKKIKHKKMRSWTFWEVA